MSKYNEALDVEEALYKLMDKDKSKEISLVFDFLHPIIENEKEKEFKRQRRMKTSWKDYVPHIEIAKACNATKSAVNFYKEAVDELHKYDQETQDLLHALELTYISEEQYSEIAKDLQEIRRYRRKAKNFIEAVEPIRNFAEENEVLIQKMCKVSGEVNKITNSINERRYYPRIRTSLEDSFRKQSSYK